MPRPLTPSPVLLLLLGLGLLAVTAAADGDDYEVTQRWHGSRATSSEAVPIGGERVANVTLRNPSHVDTLEVAVVTVELWNGPSVPPQLVPTLPATWFSVLGAGSGPFTLQPGASELVRVAFRPEAALGGALPRLVVTGRVGDDGETRRLASNNPDDIIARFLTGPTHVSISVARPGEERDPSSYSVSGVASARQEFCPVELDPTSDSVQCLFSAAQVSLLSIHGDSVQGGRIQAAETGPVKFYPADGGALKNATASTITPPYFNLSDSFDRDTHYYSWSSKGAFSFDPDTSLGAGLYKSTLTVRTNSSLNATRVFPIEATIRPAAVVDLKNARSGRPGGAQLGNTRVVYNSTLAEDAERMDDPLNVSDPHAFTAATSGTVEFEFEVQSRSDNPFSIINVTRASLFLESPTLPCFDAPDSFFTYRVEDSGSFGPGDKVLLKGSFDAKGCVEYAIENEIGYLDWEAFPGANTFNGSLDVDLHFSNGGSVGTSFPFGMRVLSSDELERELRGDGDDDDSGLSGGAVAAIVIGLLAGVGVAAFAVVQHKRQKESAARTSGVAGGLMADDPEDGYTAMQ